MLFKILLNYIKGYVKVSIEGYYVERFINICKIKNIFFWNVKKEKSGIFKANIGIKDFKRVREIARKIKCHVLIISKQGLPFIFYKYKKRKIIFALFILLLVLLVISSKYVWNIEINGNETLEKEYIQELLMNAGLKQGGLKKNIDINKISSSVRLQCDKIAWLGIEIKGTNVNVNLVEMTDKPEIINESAFSNIVANKEGIITKINVRNGTAVAQVGDVVQVGDVLVEGKIEGKYTDAQIVNAEAEIVAKVWYSKKCKENFIQEKEFESGNVENKYQICFNNYKINLYKTISNFEKYDTIREVKKLKLFSNFYLPFELVKLINVEKNAEIVNYSESELKTKIINQLEGEFEQEFDEEDNIVNKYVQIHKDDEGIEIELIYEVLENIGQKESIIS